MYAHILECKAPARWDDGSKDELDKTKVDRSKHRVRKSMYGPKKKKKKKKKEDSEWAEKGDLQRRAQLSLAQARAVTSAPSAASSALNPLFSGFAG